MCMLITNRKVGMVCCPLWLQAQAMARSYGGGGGFYGRKLQGTFRKLLGTDSIQTTAAVQKTDKVQEVDCCGGGWGSWGGWGNPGWGGSPWGWGGGNSWSNANAFANAGEVLGLPACRTMWTQIVKTVCKMHCSGAQPPGKIQGYRLRGAAFSQPIHNIGKFRNMSSR